MKQRKLRRREREATCARLRVWSSNTQGLPQFRALLGLIQQTPALRRSCAAVLQQETQRDAIGTGIYREECARRGVKLTGEPGNTTADGGCSAGVSVAVLADGPAVTVPCILAEVTRPHAAAGRVAAVAIAFGRG